MKRGIKMKKVLIIGAGGHSKVIIDILKKNSEIEISGIIDDKYVGKEQVFFSGIPIIGTIEDIEKYKNDYSFVVAIGNNAVRENIMKKNGAEFIKVINNSAIIAEDVTIGMGTFIGAGVIINTETQIGKGCIINTGCIVEHDCIIEDFVHLSSGAIVAGGSVVKEGVYVGTGKIIKRNQTILEDIYD